MKIIWLLPKFIQDDLKLDQNEKNKKTVYLLAVDGESFSDPKIQLF
jgi:hypothetical protein